MDRSSNLANGASANQTHSLNPTSARELLAAVDRPADLLPSTRPPPQVSQAPSTTTSTSNSPFESREPSPTRPSARSSKPAKITTVAAPSSVSSAAAASVQATLPLSSPTTPSTSPSPRPQRRKSTQQDPSPSRSIRSGVAANTNSTTTTITSQTASLSSTIIPTLTPAASDASTVQTPGPQKSELPSLPSPRWPVPARLRSPPPNLQRPEQSGTAAALSVEPVPTPSDSEAEDAHMLSGMRTPNRAVAIGSGPMLETVQEASPLASPRVLDAALEKLETASVASNASIATSMSEIAEVSPSRTIRARYLTIQNPFESGSESGGGAGSTRAGRRGAGPTSNAPLLTPRHSSSTIRGSISKGKTGEGAQPTMTVETETVTSIPNVAVGPATVQGANGSLRTRPSNETIRPKKEKRKASRKQAVTQGTGTSKADIFEAKVASAVDEANTSDSEETFVYDSNPADGRDRPHRFHHSRTPSATSLANTDRNGMRSIHSVLEGGPASSTVKKMKFVNTFGNTSGNDSALGDDEGKGSASRGQGGGSGRGTARLHHHVGGGSHIGRWGLSGPRNGGHQSLFDNESPFASNGTMRLKMNGASGSNGNSSAQPRAGGGLRPLGGGSFNSMRGSGAYSKRGGLGYDMEEASSGMGGRDGNSERTPLLEGSSMRTGRNGRSLRRPPPPMSLRALEHQPHQGSYAPPPSFLNRFASCLVLTVMLMLVISGAIGFMFATSQPLEDIELVKIGSVLASEQELMFDLMVRAHNPNVVVVSVDSADMEVFAKSPHAGTDSEWWRRPHGGKEEGHREHDKKEGEVSIDGNEPRDQPDSSPNFLLGKFTTFDNPLSFEGSFFHHGFSTSRSGVRIRRPGNGTAGGSERWERILDDEFDLIVKGVLRYSLPLSQRVRSALIEGRTTVKPNAADDPVLHPNGTVTGS